MLNNVVDSIRNEEAQFVHELAFVREINEEDKLADVMDKVESRYMRETSEDFMEAKKMVDRMPSEITTEDADEVNTLLESTNDISFDEMIGNVDNFF